MKVVIAGSRWITNKEAVAEAIAFSGFKITEGVSGCAKGVDTVGEIICMERGIPVKHFPANWELHGHAAGPFRNKEMAEYADALIAVWDSKSHGTLDMMRQMGKKNKPVYVYHYAEVQNFEDKPKNDNFNALFDDWS